MRTPTCLCLLLICMLISCTPTQEKHEIDYTSYVNPFIGTDFTGNTYPGAQAPFGMVQLSPDNGLPGWDRISGYFYPDSTIAGFSHTHLSGTVAGELYDIFSVEDRCIFPFLFYACYAALQRSKRSTGHSLQVLPR